MGIRVSVRLYNRLQLLLPPEMGGKTELELPEGSTLGEVFGALGLPRPFPIAVNGVIEPNLDRTLEEGDSVSVFAPASGG